jgi:tyrosyl-tRNA synthetase
VPAGESVLDILKERGFVAQVTDDAGISDLLQAPATCYIGFDPTADSLHVGSLVPIMALMHMQRQGHRPIVLVGGGTGLVGDPSGKTEMRQLLSLEQINQNAQALQRQLSRFLDFSAGGALLLNNADWLVDLRYIDFLRDIGQHFSVNRMLTAESYRIRLETGLSFIEFNYMLLQAYDFLFLAQHHDCLLQMGGNDQWGNIVAGTDLIRRKMGRTAYGLTFPLMTTASGAKMGKTAAGAVWLDAEKTSPYDFYQYWVNTDDQDVERFLSLYTFLPVEELEASRGLDGQDLNACKSILAFEVTALAHGIDQALAAHQGAGQLFGQRAIPGDLLPSSGIPRTLGGEDHATVPTLFVDAERLRNGVTLVDLLVETGLCASRSAARRLVQQGGAYVNQDRVSEAEWRVRPEHLGANGVLLRAGKKKIYRVRLRR